MNIAFAIGGDITVKDDENKVYDNTNVLGYYLETIWFVHVSDSSV